MLGGRWLRLLLALSVPLEHRLAAAEPRANPSSRSSNPPGASSLRFRRVYTLPSSVPEWPRGSTRYIPIDGDEFERLITAAAASSEDSPVATTLVGATLTKPSSMAVTICKARSPGTSTIPPSRRQCCPLRHSASHLERYVGASLFDARKWVYRPAAKQHSSSNAQVN